ncbi:NADP-dependent oxidoreductase domain-containing protein [Armillaria borealis]|uniref:NADP-dependent oxidoreductase domain-containing protein n=1 Tax=Armillaria borealis TaxID=47425 RepID=A0AA39J696_9AGAR|nr:NADP-dependent oxidoreductase domain-containing protein [Armillaria borealis]
MPLFQPASDPPTKLGVHRVLSSRAGVMVSPLVFGAMSISDKWEALGMGSMNKESNLKLLDADYDMGGNFIDTANNYQDETSEEFVGELAEKRGLRDQLYSMNYKRADDAVAQKINYVGNNTKSMHLSTSIAEVMDSLHNRVASQKVLYLGASDNPRYAMDHGKTPFVIYQGKWNILDRSFEREIIPMARSLGLVLAPSYVLAEGRLRTDAEEQQHRETEEKGPMLSHENLERTEVEIKASKALEKVAAEVGVGFSTTMAVVAIAYVMQKTTNVFPIIGGRKVEHLKLNLDALDITLSKEQIEYLDGAVPFDPGFSTTMVGDGSTYNIFLASTAKMAKLPALQPIEP